MLILILIDVQLMFSIHKKLFLALKKVLIVKITPPPGSLHPVKKFSPVKFLIPPPLLGGGNFHPHPLLLFEKPCHRLLSQF